MDQRGEVTWKRFTYALAVAFIALLVSFLIVNVAMIAWYARTDPHDGQGSFAAFMWGLLIAPVCAFATLVLVLFRRGR